VKYPLHLSEADVKQLEFEVVSDDLLIYLTRKLERWAEEPDDVDGILMRKNRLINMSRTISGGKIYVLEADDMGDYWPQDRIYHDGEFKLIFRRLSTAELAEFLCDLIEQDYFGIEEINDLMEKDGASFRFFESHRADVGVEVMPLKELEEKEPVAEHVNIRVLVHRMDTAREAEDYAGVLHASASIFETLAKDIVGIATVQDKTLKGFFDRYRKDSALPDAFLDYILETYERRNVTPLAGHGSTAIPAITKEQSIILAEMTKAFVRSEYRLRMGA
jgi:hypothetical protein